MVQNTALNDREPKIISWLVAAAFFMQMMDGTILNTALPAIAGSIGESPLRMQAVVIAYMLTVAILIPASGWLSDRFRAQRVFLGAIVLFSLGSLFCALSNSLTTLVASRIIQGMGGAFMLPVGRLVILKTFPKVQLVWALSFITMPGLVGSSVGPAVGGLLVQYASWHWIFLINLPIGLIGALLVVKYMPVFQPMADDSFDWPGFLLFSSAMVIISMPWKVLANST